MLDFIMMLFTKFIVDFSWSVACSEQLPHCRGGLGLKLES